MPDWTCNKTPHFKHELSTSQFTNSIFMWLAPTLLVDPGPRFWSCCISFETVHLNCMIGEVPKSYIACMLFYKFLATWPQTFEKKKKKEGKYINQSYLAQWSNSPQMIEPKIQVPQFCTFAQIIYFRKLVPT